jgi:hypothetical protein
VVEREHGVGRRKVKGVVSWEKKLRPKASRQLLKPEVGPVVGVALPHGV